MTDSPHITASRHIEEHAVDGRRLGRHVLHDMRSKEFPAQQATKIVSVAHKAVGLPLDQGDWGSCTGEAAAGDCNSAPDFKGHVLIQKDAFAIYELEAKLEGYQTPPDDPGGTGLMVCKAARQMGLIRSYHHAFGLDHALKALVLRPVMFGVDWYEGFDHPDSSGLVKIAGGVRGGHEFAGLGIDADRKRVWFPNSWGMGYGVAASQIGLAGGAFCMSFDTLDQLLANQGDCTVPVV